MLFRSLWMCDQGAGSGGSPGDCGYVTEEQDLGGHPGDCRCVSPGAGSGGVTLETVAV